MNGRAYDYNLGRFLSVDPVIQSPGNSQSLNPYSYIMNNPLAGTDPTGYMGCTVSKIERVCEETDANHGGRAAPGTIPSDMKISSAGKGNGSQGVKHQFQTNMHAAADISSQSQHLDNALADTKAGDYFDALLSDGGWSAWGAGVAGISLETTQGLSMVSGRGAFLGIQAFGSTLGDFSLVRNPTNSSNGISRVLVNLDYSAFGKLVSNTAGFAGLALSAISSNRAHNQGLISTEELAAKTFFDSVMLMVATRGGIYGAVVAGAYGLIDLTYGPQNGLPGAIALHRDLSNLNRILSHSRLENHRAFNNAVEVYRNSPTEFMYKTFSVDSIRMKFN